jgi:hypothetical protein
VISAAAGQAQQYPVKFHYKSMWERSFPRILNACQVQSEFNTCHQKQSLEIDKNNHHFLPGDDFYRFPAECLAAGRRMDETSGGFPFANLTVAGVRAPHPKPRPKHDSFREQP